jgi:prepilin-type processing-associated H-X9-DG protein
MNRWTTTPFVSRRQIAAAFALIELMVVIGIVALLAALLLAELANAKASARSIACRSNLRQIGIALNSYTHDEEQYPPYEEEDPGLLLIYAWPAHLLSHLGSNTAVFRCPAANRDMEWTQAPNGPRKFPFNVTAYSKFSYGYNAFGVASGGGIGTGFGLGQYLPAQKVVAPSEMIALMDSDGDGTADAEVKYYKPLSLPMPLTPPGNRHRNGANTLFCDGHVEWEQQRNWIARKDEIARRWNNDNQPHPEFWRGNRF